MKKLSLLFQLMLISGLLVAQGAQYELGKLMVKVKDASEINLKQWLPNDIKDSYYISDIINVFNPRDLENKYAKRLMRTYSLSLNEDYIEKAISLFESLDFIEYAERIPLIELLFVPNDSLYKTSIAGANPIWPLQKINATTAWSYTHGSPDIRVAIIDNAIWTSHPDLAGKFVDIYDFADNDNNTDPQSFSNDALGRQWTHGTHVAGLAGAQTNNNRGIASIGFNTSLMAYKMYKNGSIPMPDLTAGCTAIQEAADRGAHVINISWGSTNNLAALQDAVNYAYNKGCVVVSAAGNNGQEQAFYPAGYNNVIAVASVGMDDKKSSFSNFGTFVDLTAPGGYGPNDAGTWSVVSTTSHLAYAWQAILGNVNYDGKVGTSMAAPIVSGLCALILSVDSTLTPDEVENILKLTSVDISSLNTAYNGKLGVGRIDAGAALAYVSGATNIKKTLAESVHMYPNPSNGYLNIMSNNNEATTIFVYNVVGKLIDCVELEKLGAIDYQFPAYLNSGIYFLTVQSGSESFRQKVILVNENNR